MAKDLTQADLDKVGQALQRPGAKPSKNGDANMGESPPKGKLWLWLTLTAIVSFALGGAVVGGIVQASHHFSDSSADAEWTK